jgi:hypothetical protein
VLGLVTVGALTSRCYDYLDVTVFDAEGHRTCAATVTAIDRGSQFELTSCYYAALTDGRWTVRASLPGSSDAVTTVQVDHAHDCIRHVQTVELTLHRAGTPSAPKPVQLPAPAVASPPEAPPAAPPQPAVPAPPAVEPAAPAPASPSSALPANSAAPVGVFPDRSETPQ